jgi:hypothetical protein
MSNSSILGPGYGSFLATGVKGNVNIGEKRAEL